jgi:hypothetical protein
MSMARSQHAPERLDPIQLRTANLVTTGGAPSYVELLTCLEMEKQAKELREKPETETVGRR